MVEFIKYKMNSPWLETELYINKLSGGYTPDNNYNQKVSELDIRTWVV